MISERKENLIDDQPCSVPLAPRPRTFFMTIRDIAFWIRSARADARLNGCLHDVGNGQAFDRLYEAVQDPFGTELAQYRYQRRKYDSLLSMLPRRRYRQVLDIGCGLGDEAINRLLPVANVGGELVGIRLLAQHGVRRSTAAASVIVEMLLHVVALYLFVVLGVACLLSLTDRIAGSSALFAIIASPLPLGFFVAWLVRRGTLLKVAENIGARAMIAKVQRFGTSSEMVQLTCAVTRLASAYSRLSLSIILQLAGLTIGCLETWLALRWLGHPLSFEGALILESTTLAVRSLLFVAPAGLGVQEAGLVGIGHMLGLSGDVAVALSLAKRMREILFGLPALAAWYMATRPKPVVAL